MRVIGAVLVLAVACTAQVNRTDGRVVNASLLHLPGESHINLSLEYGVFRYEAPHGLSYDNRGAVTKAECPACFHIAENKHGEVWLGLWFGPQYAYVGKFVGGLVEDDTVTSQKLLIRRISGELEGWYMLGGRVCPAHAFFSQATNATVPIVDMGGPGGLDIRLGGGC